MALVSWCALQEDAAKWTATSMEGQIDWRMWEVLGFAGKCCDARLLAS
ncbi:MULTISPECIES: hypothetical protein [Cyanophyceae]|nr:hypothetical protein [Trichocoleus sp. FACHB-40]MBD2006361.1 hypothetical protein [Trichocoleus sp. FACHB-40]